MDGGEDGEHGPAEQHVVEMRDHEVAVSDLLIERDRGEHHPGHASHDEAAVGDRGGRQVTLLANAEPERQGRREEHL